MGIMIRPAWEVWKEPTRKNLSLFPNLVGELSFDRGLAVKSHANPCQYATIFGMHSAEKGHGLKFVARHFNIIR